MGHPDGPLRRVVNEIFGDALPSTTRDERADEPSEDDAEREAWLRENVPPHHG